MKTKSFIVRSAYILAGVLLLCPMPGSAQYKDTVNICATGLVQLTSETAASLIESVAGVSGVTYQWLKSGVPIDNATEATCVVENLAVGTYSFVRQARPDHPQCEDWITSSGAIKVRVHDCVISGNDPGSTYTFIDPRDNQPYKVVKMPDNKEWFARNLNYTKDLTFNASAAGPATGSSCVACIGHYWCPGVSGATTATAVACDTYGALYTWATAMMEDGLYDGSDEKGTAWDVAWLSSCTYTPGATTSGAATVNCARGYQNHGICPKGWHVPTSHEWSFLFDALVGSGSAFANRGPDASIDNSTRYGSALFTTLRCPASNTECNSESNPSWIYKTPDLVLTDPWGFALLAGGLRGTDGKYAQRGLFGRFQTASAYTINASWQENFHWAAVSNIRVGNMYGTGLSVRCIRNY